MDLNLLLVGDGPSRNQLISFAKTLASYRSIHFIGEKKTSKELYARAELLVLTSDFEGFPNVIIEALNNACPVGHHGLSQWPR
jgi:glycosyltransferase involved in cell wall biosynthesis